MRSHRAPLRGLFLLVSLALHAGVLAGQGPELDYLQFCAGCHSLDGAGSERNEVPDMRGSIGHFTRLAEGRAFLIQVAGVAQAPLPANELAELMNWMLAQLSGDALPDDFRPYTATEVARLRADRPADLPAVRARVLQQLGPIAASIPGY